MNTKTKKFAAGMLIFGSAAVGSLGLAAPSFADGPTFADPGVVVVTGGLNSGPTAHGRVGDLGIVRPSLMATPKIKQGYVTLCNTNAADGYGHALDKACG